MKNLSYIFLSYVHYWILRNTYEVIENLGDFTEMHFEDKQKAYKYSSNYSEKQLIDIYKILNKRFDFTYGNILDNYDHLLISHFIYTNWRMKIKKDIRKRINRTNIEKIKNTIISSLEEIQFLTKLGFIIDMNNELFLKDKLTLEEQFNLQVPYVHDEGEIIYQKSASWEYLNFFLHWNTRKQSLNDIIFWIKNLSIEDVENQKIILSSKLSKHKLYGLINEILKGKRKVDTNEIELKKFINFITDKEENNNDFEYNLSFLKDKKKDFAKIFLLLQLKKLILNETKMELTKILADCLNMSSSSLNHPFPIKVLKEELEDNSTPEAYLINEWF